MLEGIVGGISDNAQDLDEAKHLNINPPRIDAKRTSAEENTIRIPTEDGTRMQYAINESLAVGRCRQRRVYR